MSHHFISKAQKVQMQLPKKEYFQNYGIPVGDADSFQSAGGPC